jgi:ABC-type multidrug transport system ATPase subunit/ABC-type multidrug transport system permease subunit
MSVAISIQGVSKSFTSQTKGHTIVKVLDQIHLEVFEGEILGLLGPNGAGKTTLLNILSTLLLPDQGRIEIHGIPVIPRHFDRLRSFLNMSSGYPNFPWSLTVEENLRFYGKLYGLSGKVLTQRIERLTAMFKLEEFIKVRFDELSSGTKQRLSLAKALLNEPKIIFLDEPTLGLDPDVAIRTRQIIQDILRNTKVTVLLTTHNMREAEQMCQRIAFIQQGRLLKLATPEELKFTQKKKDLEEVFLELAQASRGTSLPSETIPVAPSVRSEPPIHAQVDAKKYNVPGSVSRRWFCRSLAFSYRNFLFAVRNFFAFVELVFWPVVSLISIGLLGDFLQLGENALAFVLTGAITAGILQVTQLDVAYSLLYEVWSKSMKHTFLTPVGVSESLFGSWLIGVVRGLAIFIILGVAAIVLFGFRLPPLSTTLIFLVGIFSAAFLLGLLVNVLILIFGQKAEITAWMFSYLFMLVAGIYYPVETLPGGLHFLAQAIPITYFLEYFRQHFGFQSSNHGVLVKGFGLVVLYVFLGLAMMRYAFHQARRNGTIVRLSE